MGIPQLPEIDIDIVYDSYSKVEKEMMELKDKQTKIGNEVKSVLYRNKIYTNFEFN